MDFIYNWLRSHTDKMLFLLIVLIVAVTATIMVDKYLRKILDRSQIPSASIFINLTRVIIWIIATALVMEPIFGINPATIITALGIGGVALSLGLKDTISNVVSGFGLMMGKVIEPGDLVTIAGMTGVVTDITWRQTVVRESNGNKLIIPNSQLNTSALEKVVPPTTASIEVLFTLKTGNDPDKVRASIASTVEKATAGIRNPDIPVTVLFTELSPYGVCGKVSVYADPGSDEGIIRDATVKALAHCDVIEQHVSQ